MPLSSLPRELARVLDAREVRTRPLRLSQVVGRNDDGTLQIVRRDGECIQRGCVTPEGVGELVLAPSTPCHAREGTGGLATLADQLPGRILWLESVEPSAYDAGQAYTVTLTGRGFTAATVFDFLRPDSEEVNADITLTERRILDDRTAELDIEVAAGAAAVHQAAMAYDDPEAAL